MSEKRLDSKGLNRRINMSLNMLAGTAASTLPKTLNCRNATTI